MSAKSVPWLMEMPTVKHIIRKFLICIFASDCHSGATDNALYAFASFCCIQQYKETCAMCNHLFEA